MSLEYRMTDTLRRAHGQGELSEPLAGENVRPPSTVAKARAGSTYLTVLSRDPNIGTRWRLITVRRVDREILRFPFLRG
jgi:hypothetical protein